MYLKSSSLVLFIGLGLVISGCSRIHSSVRTSYCQPAFHVEDPYIPLTNTDSLLKHTTGLSPYFSSHDLLMANATGTLTFLEKLIQKQADSSLAGKVNRLHLKNELQNRLLLVSTELNSFSAELDCEGERADQLASYLDERADHRNDLLTVASITVGALTTILTVAIPSDATQKTVGLVGGLMSGGLGGSSLIKGRKVQFDHPRNVLRDIWLMPEKSEVYTPFIWYMLNEKSFSNEHKQGIIRSIHDRWLTLAFDGDKGGKKQQLLFGKGGTYKAEDLHTRADLLNQLQSSIRSLNQDLQSFVMAVNRLP
ncbi:hypothetical protein [Siphonobacter sp. SORGH_AS_1065]|uniref:hypothetical protein n=1 Tax=Siphonobacter sp. SORGH_AS_1065 TaxID=3041795 RepID=UPI0027896080|nr:hypothetical protein [Siphonobacter sp. SORGH_AS_1065]MDQ1087764.1 hypothetical protein [Siphonobacter sp. SORGH_AS_1065]